VAVPGLFPVFSGSVFRISTEAVLTVGLTYDLHRPRVNEVNIHSMIWVSMCLPHNIVKTSGGMITLIR